MKTGERFQTEKKKDTRVLEKAVPFDSRITIDKEIKDSVVKELLNDLPVSNYRRNQKKEVLAGILVNLKFAGILNSGIIRYSRNRNMKYQNSTWGTTTVLELIDTMEKQNLVETKPGFYNREMNYRRQSRLWPTEKLVPVLRRIPSDSVILNYPSVIVKNENKKTVSPPDTEYAEELRTFTDCYNSFISQFHVTLPVNGNLYPIIPVVSMIFNNNSFKQGGRLYTRFGQQQIGENERKTVLIGGEPVCELDYSGMHIHMLYALKGLSNPLNPYVYSKYRDPVMREIMKKVHLICINTENHRQAVKSISEHIYHRKLIDPDEIHYRRELKKRNIEGPEQLIDIFSEHHKTVQEYFFSNYGVTLQNMDSGITRRILEHFIKKGIPCLPVHDSYIVPKSCQSELYEVMKETYYNVMNHDCPVTE